MLLTILFIFVLNDFLGALLFITSALHCVTPAVNDITYWLNLQHRDLFANVNNILNINRLLLPEMCTYLYVGAYKKSTIIHDKSLD